MRRKSPIRLAIITIGVVIVVTFGWIQLANKAKADDFYSGETSTEGIVPVFSAMSEDGSVEYGYSIEIQTQFAGAMVTYDYLSEEGIEQFVAFNYTALESLAKSADATNDLAALITFSRPLTQDEFVEFVNQYHLTVESYTIWINNEDGTTTTIQGLPSETDLIPGEMFENALADIEARGGQEFLGWVDVNGSVKAGNLKAIADDERVFLVDLTEALIREHYTNEAMRQAGVPSDVRTAVLSEDLQVSRPPLAWQVRELGLGNMTP